MSIICFRVASVIMPSDLEECRDGLHARQQSRGNGEVRLISHGADGTCRSSIGPVMGQVVSRLAQPLTVVNSAPILSIKLDWKFPVGAGSLGNRGPFAFLGEDFQTPSLYFSGRTAAKLCFQGFIRAVRLVRSQNFDPYRPCRPRRTPRPSPMSFARQAP